MGSSSNSHVALVINGSTLEAHQRDKASQEEVYLLILAQLLHDSVGKQAVIRMVIDGLNAHGGHELVKALGSDTLEECVRITLAAHAVNHITAIKISVHHIVHGVDIVLTVAVDRNCHITLVDRVHKPCQHCILMSPVAALGNTLEMHVPLSQTADNVPCLILAAVIYEKNAAVIAYLALSDKGSKLFKKHLAGNGKHLFLIIAGNYYV